MIFRGKLRQDMTNAMLSGLFNIDVKQVKVAITVVMRHSEDNQNFIELEHFNGNTLS